MGPRPSPRINIESPRVATSREQLNSSSIWAYVLVYIDDAQVLICKSD